ncbi:unnamed protein product [Cylindrotheca closterium]|uniref:Arf-GAP domain-containing protein n=1 Tax=Cylindrotheca closterium TaxID=2856 RepID=A0AAD2FWM2_9STRA|nr:unnamed protein product [Cylindrotheca closterium]
MSDQKAMKKRLKALMALSENQVCADCPEKKPTWASIIAPPPGSPPGTEKTGAFVCLECSGSHRRLGVHITFVRSVNLDSWKDWEVRAMENGGNTKVNVIFEANLDREKPSNHATGPTRERYIRDKYERRKYFNPAGFSMPGNSGSTGGNGQAPRSAGATSLSRPGAPSEIARQRVAQRQARMKTAQSQAEVPRPSKPQVAQAPASAPVVMDLLDFGTSPAPPPAGPPSVGFTSDPFAPQPTGTQPITNMTNPTPAPAAVAAPPSQPPTLAPPPQQGQEQRAKQPGSEFLTPAPAAAQPQMASNDSIMALFNTPVQTNAGFGMQSGMMNNNMGMMAGMIPQQQQQQPQHGIPGGMMNPGTQQQHLNGGGMVGNVSQMMNGGQMTNPQMMMTNGNMQQQQQMMMMMMMQQQQMQKQMQTPNNGMNQMNMSNAFPQQGNQTMMGGMINVVGNNDMNAMGQSMQQMNLGVGRNQHNSDDGGFGVPMGGNAPKKDDPFSSLGGMNAFR